MLIAEAARLKKRAAVSIRVNPDAVAGGHPYYRNRAAASQIWSGLMRAKNVYLAHRDSKWIEWQGIGSHVGSQVLSLTPYRQALRKLSGYVRDLEANGVRLRYLDIEADWACDTRQKIRRRRASMQKFLPRKRAGLGATY